MTGLSLFGTTPGIRTWFGGNVSLQAPNIDSLTPSSQLRPHLIHALISLTQVTVHDLTLSHAQESKSPRLDAIQPVSLGLRPTRGRALTRLRALDAPKALVALVEDGVDALEEGVAEDVEVHVAAGLDAAVDLRTR